MIDLRLLLAESLGERYRVVRELTGGGMSRVFLAEEVALSRDVVVKVLSPDLVGAQHLERFRQEILQTARLQHPSIVPILSVGMLRYPTGAAAPYYIMPYIRGETLRSRLEREGPFSTSSILRVLRDVLEALVHAHRHGVIHRDIKPENIFISGGHAVVTDFGIAKAVSSAGDSPANTLPGVAVGTPAYMAPEQAAGDDGVDQRSDLYALGVVAYELLTGHAPFAGQNTRQLIVAHVRSTPEPLGQRRPDLPPTLAGAVMRCMEKAPEQRWQTADELLRVLEGIRSSDPHLTASRELPAGATPRSRQARWVGGLAVAAAAVAGWLLLGSPDSPRRPIQPKISVMVMSPDVIGDSALHEFARAMQTELTHYLQRLGLSVLDAHASDGMLRLTNQEKAERLGAAFLVTTSLNRDSNGIRAIVNLTDDRMVLQDVWDYSLPDADPRRALEALVDSAATDLDGRLPAAVRQASLPGTADQVLERRSLSPEIAGLVERADSGVRTRTRSGLLQSIALLGEALTQDPGNGYLHARMSSAYALVTVYQYRADFDLHDAAARSLAHADRAIALDPSSDEAFAARAYILNQVNAPTDSIRAYFEVALRLNPSAQPGWYSVLLMKEGKKDSALAEARRGVALDPRAPGRRINLAWDALGLREDQLAVQEADSAWQLDRRLELARSLLVRSLLAAGQNQRCASMDPGPFLGTQAACLEAMGRREDAARQVDSVLARFRVPELDTVYTPVVQAQELAVYFAARGEASASMFWVREAFRQAPNGMPWIVLRSRIFDRVRRDPLFARELEVIETAAYPRVTQAARSYLAALTSLRSN